MRPGSVTAYPSWHGGGDRRPAACPQIRRRGWQGVSRALRSKPLRKRTVSAPRMWLAMNGNRNRLGGQAQTEVLFHSLCGDPLVVPGLFVSLCRPPRGDDAAGQLGHAGSDIIFRMETCSWPSAWLAGSIWWLDTRHNCCGCGYARRFQLKIAYFHRGSPAGPRFGTYFGHGDRST